MDMTASIVPRSDQLNADDMMSGPMTVTISEVTQGNAEQPVNVNLVEFPGRAYRPSKSMRRVMVSAWGKDASAYAGHRLTLYRNPEITFGRDKVGGIEISHMSHLDKPLTVSLTATRGKRKSFKVEPLMEAAPQPVDLSIPADVLANVAKASADGNLPAYLEYLVGQGAPQHIIEHIQASINEQPVLPVGSDVD